MAWASAQVGVRGEGGPFIPQFIAQVGYLSFLYIRERERERVRRDRQDLDFLLLLYWGGDALCDWEAPGTRQRQDNDESWPVCTVCTYTNPGKHWYFGTLFCCTAYCTLLHTAHCTLLHCI